MWGIWCFAADDWLREDEAGIAVLAFRFKADATDRAAVEFGCDTYEEALADGHCKVERLDRSRRL